MTMRYSSRAYGAAFVVVLSACSSPPSNEPPVVTDAGAGDYPLLPPECDKAPNATSTGGGPLPELAHFQLRIRASGNTVYYHRRGGIHAIQVPGGTGSLLVPYPTKIESPDAAARMLSFEDFWVDEKSIVGAVGSALYAASFSGGPAELVPGYKAESSSLNEYGDLSYYARSGEYLFRSGGNGLSTAAVERMPLSGGPSSTFIALRASKAGPIVIGGQSLYFLDREEGDDNETASIFVTPLDANAPVPVARHLKSPRLLGFLDGSLYFDDKSGARALWRTRSDSSVEKVAMPSYVELSIGVDSTRFATVGGVGYLTGVALYRLPNDGGTSLRDVVLRLRPDSDKVDVAHCLDRTVNRPDKFVLLIDLTASDSQLYLARSISDHAKNTWEDEILELAP